MELLVSAVLLNLAIDLLSGVAARLIILFAFRLLRWWTVVLRYQQPGGPTPYEVSMALLSALLWGAWLGGHGVGWDVVAPRVSAYLLGLLLGGMLWRWWNRPKPPKRERRALQWNRAWTWLTPAPIADPGAATD